MGKYIRGPLKKQATLEEHGGKQISQPATFSAIPAGKALVGVKDNGPFEAAAWVFDAKEFEEFTDPSDPRPTSFWLLDLETVEKLVGG